MVGLSWVLSIGWVHSREYIYRSTLSFYLIRPALYSHIPHMMIIRLWMPYNWKFYDNQMHGLISFFSFLSLFFFFFCFRKRKSSFVNHPFYLMSSSIPRSLKPQERNVKTPLRRPSRGKGGHKVWCERRCYARITSHTYHGHRMDLQTHLHQTVSHALWHSITNHWIIVIISRYAR